MSCREIEHLFAEYVDGVLNTAERTQVEQHLAECPHCAKTLAELRQLMTILEKVRHEPSPTELTDNIFAATTRRRPRFSRRRRFLSKDKFPLSAAAAILVALIAVVAVYSNLEMQNHLPKAAQETIVEKPLETAAQPAAKLAFMIDDDKERHADAVVLLGAMTDHEEAVDKTRAKGVARSGASGAHKKSAARNGLRTAAYGSSAATDMIVIPPPTQLLAPAQEKPKPKREDARQPLAEENRLGDRVIPAEAEEDSDEYRRLDTGGVAESGREQKKIKSKKMPAAAPKSRMRFFSRQKQRVTSAQAGGGEGAVPTTIAHRWEGRHSGLTKPGRVVVMTTEKWRMLWKYVNAKFIEQPPLPPIDFEKQIVIAVYMGLRSTGGFAISITQVAAVGDHLEVTVQQTTPRPGQMVTQALTQPFSAVVVTRTIGGLTVKADTPIKFIYR